LVALPRPSDFSHPDKVQFNVKEKPEIPTDHASAHHYIYSGLLAKDMEAIKAGFEKVLEFAEEVKAWKQMQEMKK
jgi:hypothetical protein